MTLIIDKYDCFGKEVAANFLLAQVYVYILARNRKSELEVVLS